MTLPPSVDARRDGRNMTMVLAPTKRKADAEQRKRREAERAERRGKARGAPQLETGQWRPTRLTNRSDGDTIASQRRIEMPRRTRLIPVLEALPHDRQAGHARQAPAPATC